jgi:hypothetical protein
VAGLTENLNEVMAVTAEAPSDVQAAAVTAAIAISGPTGEGINWVWKTLVGGLVLALIASLVGIMWAVLDKSGATSPDTLITIFTAVLTGLIGLFVKTPSQS